MSRYIDADKLIAHLEDEINGCTVPIGGRACGKGITYGTVLGLKMAISYAETMPTADVVEVVRCKDCVHRFKDSDGDFCCDLDDCYACETGFCSYGKRSENGT